MKITVFIAQETVIFHLVVAWCSG